MKLTTREYCDFYGSFVSKEAVANKCRTGELAAEKDSKGRWLIDVPIPEEVFKAKMKANEKRAYANKLYRELRKTEKEVEELMKIVIEFIDQSKEIP